MTGQVCSISTFAHNVFSAQLTLASIHSFIEIPPSLAFGRRHFGTKFADTAMLWSFQVKLDLLEPVLITVMTSHAISHGANIKLSKMRILIETTGLNSSESSNTIYVLIIRIQKAVLGCVNGCAHLNQTH